MIICMTSVEKNPNVPRKPDEIVPDVFRCLDAGASLIHAHNDDISVSGQTAADDYLAAVMVTHSAHAIARTAEKVALIDGTVQAFTEPADNPLNGCRIHCNQATKAVLGNFTALLDHR